MHVLAVISKAVFEKQARSAGKRVGVGDTWPTSLYASSHASLDALGSGGALFLVTVRPGDRLWLVGILESPSKSAAGWRAPPNSTAVRDVTTLMKQLRFASGKGITAAPGKLGMSLQTPRHLTEDDVTLLRTVTSVPAANVLRFDNTRRRSRWSKCTAAEQALLGDWSGAIRDAHEFGGAALVDVIDTRSGVASHLLALWPFGSGVLIELASKQPAGHICQHSFDAYAGQTLRPQLAAAYAEAKACGTITELVDFHHGGTLARATAREPLDADTLAEIRALRMQVAADPESLRPPQEQGKLLSLLQRVFDTNESYRPVPVRRLFELSETEREMLELVEDAEEGGRDLWFYGLPNPQGKHWRRHYPNLDAGELARFLGRAPLGPLDECLELQGHAHPWWCLFHDAIYGARDVASVLELVAAQPLARRLALTRAVLISRSERLTRAIAADLEELRRSSISRKARRPQIERRASLIAGLFASLGAAREPLCCELLAERADAAWIETWRAELTQNPALRSPDVPLLCTCLDLLARAAAERGASLDPAHDPLLGVLALASYAKDAVAEILTLLPRERADHIG